MIKLQLPSTELPAPARMERVARSCRNAVPHALIPEREPNFPIRPIDALLALLAAGEGQRIGLMEWVMLLRRKQEWDGRHPDRSRASARAIWREALGNLPLERLLCWRLALRAGGLGEARLPDSLWDTFDEYAGQRADTSGTRLLKALIERDWSMIATLVLREQSPVQSVFARAGLPPLLPVVDAIHRALVPAFLDSNRTKATANGLLRCIQGLRTDARVEAVEQLVLGIDAADAADWPKLHAWVLGRFGPHAADSLWYRLSPQAQARLQTWLSAARYRDFERIVELITRRKPDKALSEEDQKDIKRLKSRSKFWANYRSRFEGLTILLPESTLGALSKQLSHLQSSEVLPLADDGSEESELCLFEFTDGYIVEVFRGGCGESRFIPKDAFPRELLEQGTLGLKDLRRVGVSEAHDHVFLWQYFCERWLRDKGIRPDDEVQQFAGLPWEAGRYDPDKGLPAPDEAELAQRHQQLLSWQRKMRRLEAEAGRPESVDAPAPDDEDRVDAPTVVQDVLADGSKGPEMVFIRGGTFTMGSPSSEADRCDNERQHQVTVGDVWIGRYVVTFEEYDRFCAATKRCQPSDNGWG